MKTTFASLNINGSQTSQCRFQNFLVLQDRKYAVCFLQETHSTLGDKATWLLKRSTCHLTTNTGRLAILLVQFTNHKLAWAFCARAKSVYWHFNNLLLESEWFWDWFVTGTGEGSRWGGRGWFSLFEAMVGNLEGIRTQIHTYYLALFTLDQSSKDVHRVLWEDMSQLSLENDRRLNTTVTFDELTGTFDWLSRGKSPGLDGLTVEFFRAFWNVLGGGLYSLCVESFLCLLWRRLSILVLCGPRMGMVLLSYTDDMLLTFTDPADLGKMHEGAKWQALYKLLQHIIHFSSFIQHMDMRCPTFLISGFPVQRGVGRMEDLLVGLLLGLAKLAINRSRQQARKGVIMADCLPLYCGNIELGCPWKRST
eukprot:g42603.t1